MDTTGNFINVGYLLKHKIRIQHFSTRNGWFFNFSPVAKRKTYLGE
jgi:hypothetical protein